MHGPSREVVAAIPATHEQDASKCYLGHHAGPITPSVLGSQAVLDEGYRTDESMMAAMRECSMAASCEDKTEEFGCNEDVGVIEAQATSYQAGEPIDLIYVDEAESPTNSPTRLVSTKSSKKSQGVQVDGSQGGAWMRYYISYTLAMIVAALVPVGCWLAVSHTTTCVSDATRRDVLGFVFGYNGGYNLLSSLLCVLFVTCQNTGIPARIQWGLLLTVPITIYVLSICTNVVLDSYGLLTSPIYWWLNKIEVVVWASLICLVILLAMQCSRPPGSTVISTFVGWFKVFLITCSILVIYYICQVYVYIFLNLKPWLLDLGLPVILISISQLILVAMFSRVAIASWDLVVHVLPFPTYDRPMKRERWHLILALISDSFKFLFGRAVFFALRHPAQLAIVIFMDYYKDFFHFFLHTQPWFILRKTKLAKEPPTAGVHVLHWALLKTNKVLAFFWPERLRAPAGIQVDVKDGGFTSKLMRPRWNATSWRTNLKDMLTLKPVQPPPRRPAPPGAVDVRMGFCDRVLFVRVFPDPTTGCALTPEGVQESTIKVVILQVAIRFHIRIISKMSASLLFILSRFILASTGGWQFHQRMKDHLTTKDLITLGVFFCMDLLELTLGCYTVYRNEEVTALAGQWLYQLYGADPDEASSVPSMLGALGSFEHRASAGLRRVGSMLGHASHGLGSCGVESSGVSMHDIRGGGDSGRRPLGVGFWLFVALAMHIATDTAFSAFRFDAWCPDALW